MSGCDYSLFKVGLIYFPVSGRMWACCYSPCSTNINNSCSSAYVVFSQGNQNTVSGCTTSVCLIERLHYYLLYWILRLIIFHKASKPFSLWYWVENINTFYHLLPNKAKYFLTADANKTWKQNNISTLDVKISSQEGCYWRENKDSVENKCAGFFSAWTCLYQIRTEQLKSKRAPFTRCDDGKWKM